MIVILTAHSGSNQTADNSLEFVKKFVEQSCEAIEVDVRKSKEGVLYLSHDWIPNTDNAVTLEEVFKKIEHTQTKVNADLKEDHLERSVFQLAEKYNVQDQVILSGTVSLANLTKIEIEKHLFYNIELFLPEIYHQNEPTIREEELVNLIEFCRTNRIKVINVHYSLANSMFIDALSKQGIYLSVWTVDDLNKINVFFKQGVFNVTSKQVLRYQNEYGKGVHV